MFSEEEMEKRDSKKNAPTFLFFVKGFMKGGVTTELFI